MVPSRCYFKRTKEKPLDGARIAVKDNFDIKNFRTSLCNRAWEELYPPADRTASSIQRLVDAGAIIVGKTRLNAMTIREDTMECVEFLAPFNPRGDGYQTSSGSSSGSCAALASYDWLDFSIGSDSKSFSRNAGLPLTSSNQQTEAVESPLIGMDALRFVQPWEFWAWTVSRDSGRELASELSKQNPSLTLEGLSICQRFSEWISQSSPTLPLFGMAIFQC